MADACSIINKKLPGAIACSRASWYNYISYSNGSLLSSFAASVVMMIIIYRLTFILHSSLYRLSPLIRRK